eukprot:XP_011438886.1 PREDICTED: uncharacterized protein LOC105336327 [Crassostrea gigas]
MATAGNGKSRLKRFATLRKTVSKFRGKGTEKTKSNDGIPSDVRKRTKPSVSSRFYTPMDYLGGEIPISQREERTIPTSETSEESLENVLTTIEKQIQFLRRREIQGQKFVQNLQKTIDHLQQNLSAEQTAKETALKDKDAAVTRLENDLQQQKDYMKKLKTDLQKTENAQIVLERENTSLIFERKRIVTDLGKSEEKIRKLEDENNTLINRMESLESELQGVNGAKEKLENEYIRLNEKTQRQREKDIDEIKALNSKLGHLEEDREKLKTEKNRFKNASEQLKNTLSEAKQTQGNLILAINERDQEINRLGTQIHMLHQKCYQTKFSLQMHRNTIDKLQMKLTEEKKEKEHALRISAHRPQDQNPEITDLSDPNRPLKLAEKVSELYDNEWTNAMENLENLDIQEDKGIKILLKIIKHVFDTCMDFGDTHLESFPDLLVLPPVIYQLQKKRVLSVKDMSSEMLKQMKDFRKLNTEHAISGLQKYFAAQRKLKIKQRVYDSCKEYIEKCVELCWMMRIQDPPIYMEADYQPNSPFDSNKMRSYTKAGKLVHFVVWPTFFFHKDGPLLAKGVVQGRKLEVAEEESSSSSADDTDDDDKYEIAPAVSSDDNKTRTDYVSDGEQSHPRNEEISNDNAPFKTKCSISDGKEELVNVAQSDTNYVNKSNDVSGCKQYIQGNDKLSSDSKEALIGAERLEYKEVGEADNDSDVKQCFQTSDKLSIANCLEHDNRGENEELPKGKHPSAEHEELLIDNNYKATGKNCTDKENNINDDDDDDGDGDYKSNLCNNVLRNTSVGVHCSGNNGEEKDIENGVAAESKKEAGTRLFINDEKFIDAQCAITCDNENKSDDVSDDNQSDGGNVMFSSDINTAPYDAEYLKNDGESEDDNGSDVKQSTDINDELSNS